LAALCGRIARVVQRPALGDGFNRPKDPTNSIKVLKENLQRKNQTTQTTKYTYAYINIQQPVNQPFRRH